MYGCTFSGGYNGGTLFELDPLTEHYKVLLHFDINLTGPSPNGSLLEGNDGNLYGTTSEGGTYGFGTVYKLDSSGHQTVPSDRGPR